MRSWWTRCCSPSIMWKQLQSISRREWLRLPEARCLMLTLNCSDYCRVSLTSTLPSSKIHSAQINSCELRFRKYRGTAYLSCLGWGGAELSALKGTHRLVTSPPPRIGSPRSASVTAICENPGGRDVWSGLLTSMELEVQKLVWVLQFNSVQSLSRVRLSDPMNRSTPAHLPVRHQLPEFTQTHIHRVNDALEFLRGE